jgi:hypothetical protein
VAEGCPNQQDNQDKAENKKDWSYQKYARKKECVWIGDRNWDKDDNRKDRGV